MAPVNALSSVYSDREDATEPKVHQYPDRESHIEDAFDPYTDVPVKNGASDYSRVSLVGNAAKFGESRSSQDLGKYLG